MTYVKAESLLKKSYAEIKHQHSERGHRFLLVSIGHAMLACSLQAFHTLLGAQSTAAGGSNTTPARATVVDRGSVGWCP